MGPRGARLRAEAEAEWQESDESACDFCGARYVAPFRFCNIDCQVNHHQRLVAAWLQKASTPVSTC